MEERIPRSRCYLKSRKVSLARAKFKTMWSETVFCCPDNICSKFPGFDTANLEQAHPPSCVT